MTTPASIIYALTYFTTIFAATAPAQHPPDAQRIQTAADTAARALIDSGVTPAVSVAVAHHDRILLARAYGHADLAAQTPATPDTPFPIGSVTKQFTAAAILKLAESGKLTLDDPVTKHLPDYPTHNQTITLRHLLTHTSGIKSFDLTEDAGQFFARDLTYPDILTRFARQPLDFPPGAQHQYNNTAYWLLGEIITRASGTPYHDYLHREFFQPLSLAHTRVCDPSTPGSPQGYDRTNNTFTPARPVNFSSIGAAGSLCSTAADLARWTHLLHSGQVLSPASLKQMTSPTTLSTGQTVDYGLGLFLGTFENYRKVYHGGRGAGFLSLVSHYPDRGISIAILMNSGSDRDRRDHLERTLARAALNIQTLDLPLTAADLQRYAGTYTLASGPRTTELHVFPESNHLHARLGSSPVTRLRYQSDHTFLHGDNDDIKLVITPDTGAVTVHRGPQSMSGIRK